MNKQKIDENAIDQTQVTKQDKILRDKPIPEKSTVVFDFMMSLENIVMAKIVNNLWMNPDVQHEIVLYLRSFNAVDWDDFWDEVEDNIVAKISKFSLPDLISSKLTYIVPAVGKSIRQWIIHFDEVLLHASKLYGLSEYGSKYYSVDLISNIAWTARGKIDYAQTATNILANPDIFLSEYVKFNIACTYCLEDEILDLEPNVVDDYFLDNIDTFMYPMVCFCKRHITVHYIENHWMSEFAFDLYHMCDSQHLPLNIEEVIFKNLIINNDWTKRTFNEVAITCVWNKLDANEKARNITSLIEKMDDQGLKYTLLSNLEYEQQQDIFKKCSFLVLDGILKDWSWEEYFLPTALHCLDVMNASEFLSILKSIIIFKIKDSPKENKFIYNHYKSIFKELWLKCSWNLKNSVLEHIDGRFLSDLLISLSCKQDMDIICLILNDLSAEQRKNLISGFNGAEWCSLLTQNDRWDLVQLFFTSALFSEDDITQLKQAFVKENGNSLAEQFLEKGALDKLEHFMTWAFNSQKEIDQFRESLSHAVICEATLRSIIFYNIADFTELENHFSWCAKGDLNVINEFKVEVSKSFHFELLIECLIENDSYDLLEKVLNWCFLDDEQKIVQFKSNMYKDDNLTWCIKVITLNLIIKDDSFTMLERFLSWCFIDEQEVKEFKTWFLDIREDPHSICAELIALKDLELADKFLKWCITSEDLGTYKNTLMLSNRDMKRIVNSDCMNKKMNLQLLIKWFNPSKVTLEKFQSLFLREEVAVPLYKLDFLREIVGNLIMYKNDEESTL